MNNFKTVQFYIENDLPSPQQMWDKLNNSKMVKANEFFEESLSDKLVKYFKRHNDDYKKEANK